MLGVLNLMRPCSKKVCKCYDKAVRLTLHLPISKDDEITNNKKINELYLYYKICTNTLDKGVNLHSTPISRQPYN